jgi:glycosyltransferase involved in cell wall biosynthesis
MASPASKTRAWRAAIGALAGVVLFGILQGARLVLWALGPRKSTGNQAEISPTWRILITGRVDSKNWCKAHLLPLSGTPNISELLLVVDGKVEAVPNARSFIVPRLIGWIKPRAIVRSLWAVRVALQERPDVVMAYSFFPPGVFALLAARLTGAAAIVQLAGGPKEIESGGIASDIPLLPEFMRKRLVPLCRTICSQFDGVIVRGHKAERYVQMNARPGRVDIIPGSVDPARFQFNGQSRNVDIVFIGRIVPIKQPDHFCQVVRRVASRRPSLRVVVAGVGPLLAEMKRQTAELGLEKVIEFAGHVEAVEDLLIRSRVFLLTSVSEGLSIAMAEAMIAGAVPVVADVGDLSELVINGQTGWLIPPGDFDAYANRICALLDDPQSWETISKNARKIAMDNNSLDSVSRRWQECLSAIAGTHARPAEEPCPT